MALLEIENLSVEFPSKTAVMHAVDGVSLTLEAGEVLGIVGESGSGKSVTMMAVRKWLKIGRFGYLPWGLWWTSFLGYLSVLVCSLSSFEVGDVSLARHVVKCFCVL